jgi:hypothetical protein
MCGGSFAKGLNCRKEEQAQMRDLFYNPKSIIILKLTWRDYQNLDLDETNLTERIMHGVVRPNEHSRMLL